jgi:hypothetical protein
MAVPFINILASSMGGIGFGEPTDGARLQKVKEANGIPFYAGRFYPKNNKSIIADLLDGLINSDTPPWLTNQVLDPTQIWMVPVFEDERIVSTNTIIERIDVWPRLPEDDNPNPAYDEDQIRHTEAVRDGWGAVTFGGSFGTNTFGNSIDPGLTVTQNVVPPPFLLGYLGISEISGHVSEYGFYDHEMHIVNHRSYGQEHLTDDLYEHIRIREDGAWKRKSAELIFDIKDDDEEGYPNGRAALPENGWSRAEYPAENYQNWVMGGDLDVNRRYGNQYWDFFTRWEGDALNGRPKAGLIQLYPSKIDTICLTIKVSCQTIVVPDTIPADAQEFLDDALAGARENLGNNLSNNVWYFYWPVRLDMDHSGERLNYFLQRQGINKLDDPNYYPPSSVL